MYLFNQNRSQGKYSIKTKKNSWRNNQGQISIEPNRNVLALFSSVLRIRSSFSVNIICQTSVNKKLTWWGNFRNVKGLLGSISRWRYKLGRGLISSASHTCKRITSGTEGKCSNQMVRTTSTISLQMRILVQNMQTKSKKCQKSVKE